MISWKLNSELEVAERNLRIFEETLEGVRWESQAANPALFPTIAQGYQRQIAALQADIAAYRHEQSTAGTRNGNAGPSLPGLKRPDYLEKVPPGLKKEGC